MWNTHNGNVPGIMKEHPYMDLFQKKLNGVTTMFAFSGKIINWTRIIFPTKTTFPNEH